MANSTPGCCSILLPDALPKRRTPATAHCWFACFATSFLVLDVRALRLHLRKRGQDGCTTYPPRARVTVTPAPCNVPGGPLHQPTTAALRYICRLHTLPLRSHRFARISTRPTYYTLWFYLVDRARGGTTADCVWWWFTPPASSSNHNAMPHPPPHSATCHHGTLGFTTALLGGHALQLPSLPLPSHHHI